MGTRLGDEIAWHLRGWQGGRDRQAGNGLRAPSPCRAFTAGIPRDAAKKPQKLNICGTAVIRSPLVLRYFLRSQDYCAVLMRWVGLGHGRDSISDSQGRGGLGEIVQ